MANGSLPGITSGAGVSDSDNVAPQAGAPFSGSSSDAMTQVGSPMRAPLQTPYAPTSQPGISDVSAGTDISSNSWQQRPSLQGMALQVGSKPSSVHHALRGTQQTFDFLWHTRCDEVE